MSQAASQRWKSARIATGAQQTLEQSVQLTLDHPERPLQTAGGCRSGCLVMPMPGRCRSSLNKGHLSEFYLQWRQA